MDLFFFGQVALLALFCYFTPSQEIEDSNIDGDRIPVDPKRQENEQRGKRIIKEEEEIESFQICKRHEKSYGRKEEREGMAYLWDLVVSDIIKYRGESRATNGRNNIDEEIL